MASALPYYGPLQLPVRRQFETDAVLDSIDVVNARIGVPRQAGCSQ
jgi:hypothetical protein